MAGIGLEELEKQRASMIEQKHAALIVAEQAQGGIALLDYLIELAVTEALTEASAAAATAIAAKRKRQRQRKKAAVPAAANGNGAEHVAGGAAVAAQVHTDYGRSGV